MLQAAALVVLLVVVACNAAVSAPLSGNQNSNDLRALNYALTLEHLEATFYTQGMQNYSADAFAAAGYNATVYNYLTLIQSHEVAHVNALNSTIRTLGGTPVPACQYSFGVTNVQQFLALAQVFENVGVTAYDGAVNTIASEMLLTVAATIATVEARHASYLNQLLGYVPFPSAFDNATAPSIIVSTVMPYIVSCPYTLDASILPVPVSQVMVPAGATRPPVPSPATAGANDLKALNYALTLEHLEATFYAQGMQNYSLANFTAAGYNSTVYAYFTLIAQHEAAHVAALNATITTLGGIPVPACTYNFGVQNVQQFVTVAQVFENTGVRAYTGAVDTISNEALLTVAATIATVEARHAAYLNVLTNQSPFPASFDDATAPSDIVAMVSPYILTCPYTLNAAALPVPLSSLPKSTSPPASTGAAQTSACFASILMLLSMCLTMSMTM